MFVATESEYLVPFDGTFRVGDAPTTPPRGQADKRRNARALKNQVEKLYDLQRKLYADDRYSLLLVFQAMDAAGKDGTIRAVMSGINPAGCQVFSFKKPSSEELDHDFLWRTSKRLPERGRIGIFNRSHYEEVLVVRVHPEYLNYQRLPDVHGGDIDALFQGRYESIRDHERHLARNGTIILKFWLNVSHQEQKNRFMERIEDPTRNWKFSYGDVEERQHWPAYMSAYEEALNQTSREHAPWYAIPADNKPFMRQRVADIIVRTLEGLNLEYPTLAARERDRLEEGRRVLMNEGIIRTASPVAPAAPTTPPEPVEPEEAPPEEVTPEDVEEPTPVAEAVPEEVLSMEEEEEVVVTPESAPEPVQEAQEPVPVEEESVIEEPEEVADVTLEAVTDAIEEPAPRKKGKKKKKKKKKKS